MKKIEEKYVRAAAVTTGLIVGSLFPAGLHRPLTVAIVLESIGSILFAVVVAFLVVEAMNRTMPLNPSKKNDENAGDREREVEQRGDDS